MHPILETVTQGADEFVALRRDIHRHPELGYQEFRTSDLVAQCLTQWGYEVERGLGGTGVVGQLRRGRAASAWACAPTWTRCRSRKPPAWNTPAATKASCTPAATTATPPCCWRRRIIWPGMASSTAR